MALPWTLKRQLTIFLMLAVFIFAVVGGVIYYLRPAPTCTDGKLNQNEERVDCGGECDACVGIVSDPVVFWTRAFEVSAGVYEVGALVENINLSAGARNLLYTVRLYENNVEIAKKDGLTFLNPRDKFLIFESGISTGERLPTRATIEFEDISWKVFTGERPNILVSSKEFLPTEARNGRVKVVLKNQTLFPIEDIFVAVSLTDGGGNSMGVSSTKVDEIAGERSSEVFFTWRYPFDPAPANIEVYLRTDLTR